jgi:hypothetical protein
MRCHWELCPSGQMTQTCSSSRNYDQAGLPLFTLVLSTRCPMALTDGKG